jgi:adenosine deaminase
VPLTVCPFSNVALRVVRRLEEHPLTDMLAAGLVVSINSDDPAYFGGYVADNYAGAGTALGLDEETLASIARNSVESSFVGEERKKALLSELDAFSAMNQR